MKKETIRVFPDYCSSGLWTDTYNTEPEDLGITDKGILIALKYWHHFWEFNIAKGGQEDVECKVSNLGISNWKKAGKEIVKLLNKNYGKKYKFIYQVDEFVC